MRGAGGDRRPSAKHLVFDPVLEWLVQRAAASGKPGTGPPRLTAEVPKRPNKLPIGLGPPAFGLAVDPRGPVVWIK